MQVHCRTAITLIVSIAFLVLASCSPIARGLKSEQGRKADMNPVMSKIQKAYSWQAFEELSEFMSADVRGDVILRNLMRSYKGLKINGVELEELEFEDEANIAFMVIKVQAFSKPSLVLKSHFDQITLAYSVLDEGWRITDITVGKASRVRPAAPVSLPE